MKRYLSILLVALMMFSVFFVTVSCNNQPAKQQEQETKVKDPLAHDGNPILPQGTEDTVIPRWSVGQGGKAGLPDYVTDGSKSNVSAELKAAIASTPQSFFAATPKRVIVLISDGMGESHLKMSREYKGELVMDLLPYITSAGTNAYAAAPSTSREVVTNSATDSCAGGTQILAGYKTRYGYISLDIDGNEVQTLAELAKKNGWKTACVTNDNIADATPADTIVHNTSRYHDPVIYYQELMEGMPDLLMGWDYGMDNFFKSANSTWALRLNAVEDDAMSDACSGKHGGDISVKYDGDDPIAYYKSLTNEGDKEIARAFSVYYRIYTREIDKTAFPTYEGWLDDPNGLAKYCTDLDTSYGKPSTHVNRKKSFQTVLGITNLDKPVMGSWLQETDDYEAPESIGPNRGYLLHSTYYPNYCEMVGYTLYQMDKMVADDANSDGFFAMIENTCTDGWGHLSPSTWMTRKVGGTINEVQCFDEGVAIAVKYVLEHPDTLLVVTADHETGGYSFGSGWESDPSKIVSTTGGHSTQLVPCIAFGAGADKFSATAIGAQHENYVTGQVIGKLMKATFTGGAYEAQAYGQPAGYPNN